MQWAKEAKEAQEDERTNSWAGLSNVTLFTQTFAHFSCSNVNCRRMFKHSNFQVCHFFITDVPHIRDISQLMFWVPINAEEVVEAEVLVLGAGMDVF